MYSRIPPIGPAAPVAGVRESPLARPGTVEGRVLAVRAPRRQQRPAPGAAERRRRPQQADPPTGKVVLVLVPDGTAVPPDLDGGEWRVFLRFARR